MIIGTIVKLIIFIEKKSLGKLLSVNIVYNSFLQTKKEIINVKYNENR